MIGPARSLPLVAGAATLLALSLAPAGAAPGPAAPPPPAAAAPQPHPAGAGPTPQGAEWPAATLTDPSPPAVETRSETAPDDLPETFGSAGPARLPGLRGGTPASAEARPPLAAWLAALHVRPGAGAAVRPRPEAGEGGPADTSGAMVGSNFPIASFVDSVSVNEALDRASIAYNPRRDEYFVTWTATTRTAMANIYGRFFAASGAPVSAAFAIAESTAVELAPSVAYDYNADQYWVAWTDLGTGSTGNIRVRRLSPTGAGVGSTITANGVGAVAFAGRIACGASRCIVTWASAPGDNNNHILARSYDAAGNPVTPAYLLSDAVGVATEPDVAFNGTDSNFLVVWYELHTSTGYDIVSHGITPDIASYGKRAISSATGDQKTPRVAFSPVAGRFFVVWYDGRSQVTWDVYGQYTGRDCVPVGTAITVYAGAYHDAFPAVAGSNAASQFVVAYQRDISGATQFQIYASVVTGTGSVGTSFQVRNWYNARYYPAIAHRTGSSDYLVCFTDDGTVTQPDIQGQIVRGDATLAGSLIVVSRGRKGQEIPRLAFASGRGEYLVAWGDYRSGSDYDLYARRVSAGGALLGSEIVVGADASIYGYPTVAYDPSADEYLVAWQEVHGPSTGYEIYARRLGGAGDLRGSAFLVSRDTNTPNEGSPRAIYNPATDQYLVAWHAYTNGQWRIWGQRVSPAGALVGSGFLISASTSVTQAPHLAWHQALNQYLATWQDLRNSGRADIYAQRLSSAGAAVGGNFAISTATGDKDGCDVAYGGPAIGYLVVFGDARSGGNDVYGQYVDGNGVLVGSSFVLANAAVAETAPVVFYDAASPGYVAAWWQYHATSDWEIWARKVPLTGGPTEPAFGVATANEVQTWPELAQNTSSGEFLLVWEDFRAGSYDVYGQLWSPAGGPACTLTCSASAPSTGPVGSPVAFTGSASPANCTGTVAYDWNFGDGTAHGTAQSPSHTYAAAGTYNWQMTASVGGATCTKTGSITITSGCSLDCSASAPSSGSAGVAVSFTASATPANCSGTVAYDWDFGDGTARGTAQNPSHAYAAAGTYSWQMTASVAGVPCSRSGSITIGGGQTQNVLWVPVVSHASGAGGSNWRSDVGFMNRSAAGPATVTLVLHTSGVALTGTRSVAANGQEIVVDVAAQLGLTSGSAALEVRSDLPLFVTSRTYNQQSSGWTYGQGNDGVAGSSGLTAGQSGWLPHLVQNGLAGQAGTYRTNVGITNTSAAGANVRLTLYDANGIQVWATARDIGPGEWYQYQEPFRTGGGRNDIAKGYAKVTANSGTGILAYGSLIDNASGDATTIVMQR